MCRWRVSQDSLVVWTQSPLVIVDRRRTSVQYRQTWRELHRSLPWVVIGSPPCTLFSTLQGLGQRNWDDPEVQAAVKAAIAHLEFCADVYAWQVAGGRYFLHEHPKSAFTFFRSKQRADLLQSCLLFACFRTDMKEQTESRHITYLSVL